MQKASSILIDGNLEKEREMDIGREAMERWRSCLTYFERGVELILVDYDLPWVEYESYMQA